MDGPLQNTTTNLYNSDTTSLQHFYIPKLHIQRPYILTVLKPSE